jgi:hypothetical protein
VLNEEAALKQSGSQRNAVLNSAHPEIRERMLSLEVVLNRKAIVPAILSTDDVSVEFHVAVNGPEIDWPLCRNGVGKIFVFL